jgi:hypothetical protein
LRTGVSSSLADDVDRDFHGPRRATVLQPVRRVRILGPAEVVVQGPVDAARLARASDRTGSDAPTDPVARIAAAAALSVLMPLIFIVTSSVSELQGQAGFDPASR